MRVMYLCLKKFNDDLIMEAEIFLSMFIKIVAPGDTEGSGGHPLSSVNLPASIKDVKGGLNFGGGSSPPWMRVLALEILRGLCGDFELLSKVWTRYDAATDVAIEETHTPVQKSPSKRAPNSNRTLVFSSMITALNRLASERPALLGTSAAVISGAVTEPNAGDYSVSGVVDGLVGMAQQAASTVGVAAVPSQGGLSTSTASVKQW